MTKTNAGRFFEDYAVGDVITHAVPRTISGGERALYHALYPARGALYSSDEFARACGLPASPVDDLVTFHTVFGKTVPDVSLNAVANLGYAEGRWLRPVYAGDTLVSQFRSDRRQTELERKIRCGLGPHHRAQSAWRRCAELCALGDGAQAW